MLLAHGVNNSVYGSPGRLRTRERAQMASECAQVILSVVKADVSSRVDTQQRIYGMRGRYNLYSIYSYIQYI